VLKCSLRYTHLSTVIRCAIISAYDYFNERKIILDLVKQIGSEQIRTDLPQLNIGDTVRVYVKVKEGNRERLQMFEGIIIQKKHGGINETFTVRRVSYGVGVERTFPVNSPSIDRIEITRRGKVRRAKLYYLRERVGKSAKVKQKL
jgi:large subunit ribosomal protein L19